MRLTLEILKKLNDFVFVVEVTGDYTGTVTSVGASHEQVYAGPPSSLEKQTKPDVNDRKQQLDEKKLQEKKSHSDNRSYYKTAVYTSVILIGVLAIAGFLVSGGMFPNINKDILVGPTSAPLAATPSQISDYGIIKGQVTGPMELPAIGASVIAYKKIGLIDSVQSPSGFTASSFVSIDGKYSLNLPSGLYTLTVAYPDGKNRTVDNYAVWSGSITTHDFKY
jgi:hypothetical protein